MGSIYMLWPWQQVRGIGGIRSSENTYQQLIILPSDYTEATGISVMVFEAIFAFFLSIVLVIYLKEFLFKQSKR